jgi:hypothetical protein
MKKHGVELIRTFWLLSGACRSVALVADFPEWGIGSAFVSLP